MERDAFAQRFREASMRARDFARTFIEEPLPDAMLFRLSLNASYDGNPLHADERVFPEDSHVERARSHSRRSGDEVVDILWRDGLIPEWINLSVIGETGTATLVEVLACGRFTANESLLYHQHEGCPPFHALGPSLPIDFEEGRAFSIYDRSDCWHADELERVARRAAKVWSLELSGPDFTDDVVASLPVLERMHILALKSSPLTGSGLATLNSQPKLRRLRVHLDQQGAFAADELPDLPKLESLTIENLRPGPWGFPSVVARTSGLERLSLASAHALDLDARLASPMESITVRARSIEGDPLPVEVKSLSLSVREASDSDVDRLLARVRHVTYLSLRGTPVSDELIERVVSRWRLAHLDVVDTRVSEACVQRIRARYPKLRISPSCDWRRSTFEHGS